MQSLLMTCSEKELGFFRRDLRTIERALAHGLCAGSGPGCCGVGLAQCHALLAIGTRGAAPSSLAKELGVDASTLTRTLDGLEKLGLIDRRSSASDRRSVIIKKTPQGDTKVREINTIWTAWFRDLLAGMRAEDRRAAIKGVAALSAAFRARPACCTKTGKKESS